MDFRNVNFEDKLIKVVFENCDMMNIVADIKINEETDSISMKVKPINNGIHYEMGADFNPTTKFSRLKRSNDITSIVIDGVVYEAVWYFENEWDWNTENKYQHTSLDSDCNLYISIRKPMKHEIHNEIYGKVRDLCEKYDISCEFRIID